MEKIDQLKMAALMGYSCMLKKPNNEELFLFIAFNRNGAYVRNRHGKLIHELRMGPKLGGYEINHFVYVGDFFLVRETSSSRIPIGQRFIDKKTGEIFKASGKANHPSKVWLQAKNKKFIEYDKCDVEPVFES
jgi:hypothetical protein